MNEFQTAGVDYSPESLRVRAQSWVQRLQEPVEQQISPKFQVFITLEGEQKFLIDGVPFSIKAGEGPNCQPQAMIMVLRQQSTLTLLPDPNKPLTKVAVAMPDDWVERFRISNAHRSKALGQFLSGHLNNLMWMPHREVVLLARRILAPPPNQCAEMQALYKTSRALELMRCACEILIEEFGEDDEGYTALPISARRQSERARDYIINNLSGDLSMERLAQETGASVRSMQRHFKDYFGQTISLFIRTRRLGAAYDALERHGLTIAQAAHLAGYVNATNFATAFKKQFGISPSQVRA